MEFKNVQAPSSLASHFTVHAHARVHAGNYTVLEEYAIAYLKTMTDTREAKEID